MPFASFILSGAAKITGATLDAKRVGQFGNISDLNPSANLFDAGLFSEKLARRLTITNQEEIMGVSSVQSEEKTSGIVGSLSVGADKVKSFANQQVAKLDAATARGIFGEELSKSGLLALDNSKAALDYVMNQSAQEVEQTKSQIRSGRVEEVIDRIAAAAIGKAVVRLETSTVFAVDTSSLPPVPVSTTISTTTIASIPAPAPIIRGASNLNSGDEIKAMIDAINAEHKAENAKREAEIKTLNDALKQTQKAARDAEQKATSAHNTVNSVFQTFAQGGQQVTEAVKTKEGATIRVVNPGLEETMGAVAKTADVNRENIDEMRDEISHLKRQLERRKNKSGKGGCEIS